MWTVGVLRVCWGADQLTALGAGETVVGPSAPLSVGGYDPGMIDLKRPDVRPPIPGTSVNVEALRLSSELKRPAPKGPGGGFIVDTGVVVDSGYAIVG